MSIERAYERAFNAAKTDLVTITDPAGPTASNNVRAKATGHRTGDLVGAAEQARFELLVLAADCTFEPRDGHFVTMRGREYKIDAADPFRRAASGKALAYHLELEA